MSVYTDLLQQLQKLDQEIKLAKAEYKKEGFAKIRALMAEYEITAEELSKKVGDKRKSVQAKYKDPETGATWSGRGRTLQSGLLEKTSISTSSSNNKARAMRVYSK